MDGRAPDKHNPYYSPKVTWLMVVLVGLALLVVGLTVCSDENLYENNTVAVDTSDSILTKPIPTIAEPQKSSEINIKDTLPWIGLERAITAAQDSLMFVMIYFSADNCKPCDQMEAETFTDSAVKSKIGQTILPVKISPDSERKFTYLGRSISESKAADIFSVPGYPSLLFYDGQSENFLFVQPGYTSPDLLLNLFSYLDERNFQHISFEEYLQK